MLRRSEGNVPKYILVHRTCKDIALVVGVLWLYSIYTLLHSVRDCIALSLSAPTHCSRSILCFVLRADILSLKMRHVHPLQVMMLLIFVEELWNSLLGVRSCMHR